MRTSYIITAGSSRLGRALVDKLSTRGDVHFTYFSDESCTERYRHTPHVHAYRLDMSQLDPARATEFIERVLDTSATDHWVLINNCSIFEYDAPRQVNFDFLNQALQVNLVAPLMLTEALLKAPFFSKGTILHILDAKLQAMNPDYFSYTLSKAGLMASLQAYASEKQTNIRFYGIAPAMFAESGPPTAGRVDDLVRLNPLHYPLNVNDVLEGVELALQGILNNGTTIYVDGGQHLLNLPRDVAFLPKDFLDVPHE